MWEWSFFFTWSINPGWAVKKKKVDEEKSSVQITGTQDGSEEAQLYNKDEHSSDEHKTPDTVKLL